MSEAIPQEVLKEVSEGSLHGIPLRPPKGNSEGNPEKHKKPNKPKKLYFRTLP